jgi:hypothetical protein
VLLSHRRVHDAKHLKYGVVKAGEASLVARVYNLHPPPPIRR